MTTLIPTTEHGWLDYNGKAYLIKPTTEPSSSANFQYNGNMCFQGSVEGFVVATFFTKSKYYNPNYWYKKTSWGNDYPNNIFFDTRNVGKLWRHFDNATSKYKYSGKRWDAFWKKIDAEADKYARPADKVLKAIIREAEKHSGLKLHFAFDDTSYGTHWWEAYVMLKDDKDTLYILTWQNCD